MDLDAGDTHRWDADRIFCRAQMLRIQIKPKTDVGNERTSEQSTAQRHQRYSDQIEKVQS